MTNGISNSTEGKVVCNVHATQQVKLQRNLGLTANSAGEPPVASPHRAVSHSCGLPTSRFSRERVPGERRPRAAAISQDVLSPAKTGGKRHLSCLHTSCKNLDKNRGRCGNSLEQLEYAINTKLAGFRQEFFKTLLGLKPQI